MHFKELLLLASTLVAGHRISAEADPPSDLSPRQLAPVDYFIGVSGVSGQHKLSLLLIQDR